MYLPKQFEETSLPTWNYAVVHVEGEGTEKALQMRDLVKKNL